MREVMKDFLEDENNFDYEAQEGEIYASELFVGEMMSIKGVPYLKTDNDNLVSMEDSIGFGLVVYQPLDKTHGTRIAPGTQFTITAR